VQGIHVLEPRAAQEGVDGRVKPGHDGLGCRVSMMGVAGGSSASENTAEPAAGTTTVMPGLDPGIHILEPRQRRKARMAGSSPAMTLPSCQRHLGDEAAAAR
jgi:hypothetical protein